MNARLAKKLRNDLTERLEKTPPPLVGGDGGEGKALWLCVHFPHLALEVFARGDTHERPLVVSIGAGTRECVLACNRAAEAGGVRPGMTVSAAYALIADLQVRARNEPAERKALTRVAAWAGQFTTTVNVALDDLVLEVGRSRRLFGGLEALLARLRRGTAALGYSARLAVAPTPLAATWLARAGVAAPITHGRELRSRLASLPIEVLTLDAETRERLADLGLRRLGDCLRLPRDGLTRRFGPALLRDLDRALGKAPDVRTAYVAPPRFSGRLLLPAPGTDSEALLFAAQRLLHELAGFLEGRAGGVQALLLALHHAAGAPTELRLRLLYPSRDPRYLRELLKVRLETLVLRAPVEEIRLHAGAVRPLPGQDGALFPERDPLPAMTWLARQSWSPGGEHRLIERLRARLGDDAVRGLCLVPEHRPERSHRPCAPGESGSRSSSHPVFEHRPLWLLVAPLPLQTVKDRPWWQGELRLQAGPERIESGWWDGQDAARDYFVAENHKGSRFWIFRERRAPRRWFLHGVFA